MCVECERWVWWWWYDGGDGGRSGVDGGGGMVVGVVLVMGSVDDVDYEIYLIMGICTNYETQTEKFIDGGGDGGVDDRGYEI